MWFRDQMGAVQAAVGADLQHRGQMGAAHETESLEPYHFGTLPQACDLALDLTLLLKRYALEEAELNGLRDELASCVRAVSRAADPLARDRALVGVFTAASALVLFVRGPKGLTDDPPPARNPAAILHT